STPYYIKGMKDFLQVSQELAVELNRVDQMKKKDREYKASQDTIKEYVLGLSKNDIKSIYSVYKDKVTQSEKLILVDIYTLIYNECLDDKCINQSCINLFRRIHDELQLTESA